MLNYNGKKTVIASQLVSLMPKHNYYFEPFMGGLGMFLNKPKAKHNMLNDIDNEVCNLWEVTQNSPNELIEYFYNMPESQGLFNLLKKTTYSEPIKKAARFLYLCNYSLYGKRGTMTIEPNNQKKLILSDIPIVSEFLTGCCIQNSDFRKAIKDFAVLKIDVNNAFAYLDPPYVNAASMYAKFSPNDRIDLLDAIIAKGFKFMYSEFLTPEIECIAKDYNLQLIEIGERRNMNNRRTEIVLVNYEIDKKPTLLLDF